MKDSVDWAALERLRAVFLGRGELRTPYWRNRSDLASYNATLGERIGWKWDAVLAELKARNWEPPAGPILDFGCGSGVAGRRVLSAFRPNSGAVLWLHDRSGLAVEYARECAVAEFPGLEVKGVGGSVLDGVDDFGLLVVSHVLGELPGRERRRLMALARRARAIVWVEPGTHADSRALIGVREELRDRFHMVAPCTHDAPCGLLAAGNEPHWCHHFGRPPWEIFSDPDWSEFSRRMGVDLRSLPYSHLVLDRRESQTPGKGWSRILGVPRCYKGYSRAFSCDAGGVQDLRVARRQFPDLVDAFADGEGPRLVRWRSEGGDVVAVEDQFPGDPGEVPASGVSDSVA